MAEIFAADQAIRNGGPIDLQAMGAGDAERRRRTLELLDHGALATGPDFYAAAFVFQHGSRPRVSCSPMFWRCGPSVWE